MSEILILFGHPAFKRSTINFALRKAVENLEGITLHDVSLILALSSTAIVLQKSMELVKLVQKHYPQLKIAVNAVDRQAAFEFILL